jgi:hypothetical protein
MLARFDRLHSMPFGFVGRQLPTQEFPVLLPLSGIQPLAALGAAINPIPVRNPIFLITPVVHSLCPKQRQHHQNVTTIC